MGEQDFQPLSSVPHPKGHADLHLKPSIQVGVKVLPPYSVEAKKEVNFNANSKAIDEALMDAPHFT